MDTTLQDPLVGRELDGRYLVRSRIARGGMATVYLALDSRLDREVGPHVQLLGHHAVKPVAGADQRKGAQRVSGGGLFSISEAP